MIELLKPFTSARQFVAAVFSWGLPLAVALGAYVAVVFPSVEGTAVAREGARALHHAGARPVWFLIGLLIILAVGLSVSSRWIYQVLEGIRWPRSVRVRRVKIHTLQWEVLTAESGLQEAKSRLEYAEQELASAGDDDPSASVATAITEKQKAEKQLKDAEEILAAAKEKLRNRPLGAMRRDRPPLFTLNSISDYPANSEWIRATRLGNRIHAFETYGVHRYALDPLALWYELLATAPKDLADNVQDARQGVELWVGAWSSAVLLGVASLATEILAVLAPSGHALITPIVVAAVCCVAASIAYRAATASVEEWRFAVTALVNLGRQPLARAYGLDMPTSFDEEKLMWEALGAYILYGSDAYADRLDEYRTRSSPATLTVPSDDREAPIRVKGEPPNR